jgi:integrase
MSSWPELLRLLLMTGRRRGELCGLMWRDLEPDLATLAVRRQRVVEDPASQVQCCAIWQVPERRCRIMTS